MTTATSSTTTTTMMMMDPNGIPFSAAAASFEQNKGGRSRAVESNFVLVISSLARLAELLFARILNRLFLPLLA